MDMRRFGGALTLLVGLVSLVLLTSSPAHAQGLLITFSFDELGNAHSVNTQGFDLRYGGTMQPDPGPGGLASALNYNLLNPPNLVGGDLIIRENSDIISDVIRFDPITGGGSLFFYSDNADGVDALADTGFPSASNTNVLTVTEVGPEGNNGFTYTPVAGQPGFVPNFNVTYIFVSDGTIAPEPGSLALLVMGGLSVAAGIQVRRKARK